MNYKNKKQKTKPESHFNDIGNKITEQNKYFAKEIKTKKRTKWKFELEVNKWGEETHLKRHWK